MYGMEVLDPETWLWEGVSPAKRHIGILPTGVGGYLNERFQIGSLCKFRLFKPHGSVHFTIKKGQPSSKVRLVRDPSANPDPLIIPPTLNKQIETYLGLSEIWRGTRSRIRTCEVMLVAGYSAPVTDFRAQALLADRARNSPKLKRLIIANPSEADRKRLIEILRGRLDSDSIITECQSLTEMEEHFTSRTW